jgi:hypothetical protein
MVLNHACRAYLKYRPFTAFLDNTLLDGGFLTDSVGRFPGLGSFAGGGVYFLEHGSDAGADVFPSYASH